jgi:hypothetical protein
MYPSMDWEAQVTNDRIGNYQAQGVQYEAFLEDEYECF